MKHFLANIGIKQVLIILTLLGIIQSAFTSIGFDEAYYWRFAQDLDWGYFDHPPMVALMITIGSFLPGTLGIRLVTIVLSILTYYIIWLLIPEESKKNKSSALIFMGLVLSIPLLNIYSFITTPDVPLIFFSALYLLVLKRFLKDQNIGNSLILGVVMAALIYSKYHGLLVILLTVAANWKLFKSPLFYLSGLTGIILYLPHLWWQYQHDFISFEYHLSYRSVLFEAKNVLNYLLNTILVLNPFIFPLFIYGYFKYGRNSGIHEHTYSFLIWSFLLFFGFTSFRGHVEPQWIVVVSIPIIIYLHQYFFKFKQLLKPFKWFAIISISLVLIGRIVLMLPFNLTKEFHSRPASFYHEIKDLAKGKPVVFVNTYTEASRYSYYTGDSTFSYNFYSFRKNQYDLWDYHTAFHNKDVFLVAYPFLRRFDEYQMKSGELMYFLDVDKISVINNLKVELIDYNMSIKSGEELEITFTVVNPYNEAINFNDSVSPSHWQIYFFELDKERVKAFEELGNASLLLPPNSKTTLKRRFLVDVPKGDYTIAMCAFPKPLFNIVLSKRTYPITIN